MPGKRQTRRKSGIVDQPEVDQPDEVNQPEEVTIAPTTQEKKYNDLFMYSYCVIKLLTTREMSQINIGNISIVQKRISVFQITSGQ
jgi:hypothetical protein